MDDEIVKDTNDALLRGFDLLDVADKTWRRPKRPTWRDTAVTASDLQHRSYPEVGWVLPGLVPEGLSLLVGRPKVGKSWLALDLALAVASGGTCLGVELEEPADVLYCALEDNERRLRSRIFKLMGDQGLAPYRDAGHVLAATGQGRRERSR